MKFSTILIITILFSLSSMTLFSGDPKVQEIKQVKTPEDVANNNNDFMIKAYKQLVSEEEGKNIFFSPFSISSALAMTYAGSDNKTETEMRNALNFGANETSFHENFGKLTTLVNSTGKKGNLQLSVANSLWLADNYEFLDTFLRTNTTFYKAATEKLNFAESEKARKTINDWVAKKTMDRIKDLIPKGILDALTKMVLTNAVYFKAEWKTQFKKHNTYPTEFSTYGNKKIKANMMKNKARFNYMENDELQFIELPYKGNDASMFVLLPKSTDGLKKIETELDLDKINEYTKQLKMKETEVHFPKFKMSLSYELKKLMKSLGMNEAFSRSADFYNMTGNKELYISAIIHKTFIEVDEKGTEAAAATAVVMRMKSAMPNPEYKIFKADHPFFYFIKENTTGSILFSGRVLEPTSK